MSAFSQQARLRPRHVHYEAVLPSFALVLADAYPMLEPVLFPTTYVEDDTHSRPPESPITFARVEGDDEAGDVFAWTVDGRRSRPHINDASASYDELRKDGENSDAVHNGAFNTFRSNETCERLNEALHPSAPNLRPRRRVLRHRLSMLVVDLALRFSRRPCGAHIGRSGL